MASEHERVYVLANCENEGDRQELRRMMSKCARYASRVLGAELRAGIGYLVGDPGEIPLARRSAEECLAFGAGDDGVTMFEEIEDRSLLAAVERVVVDRHEGPSSAYRALVEYDQRHETDFVDTLRAVLNNSGNVIRVAEQLHLHANSVRYRVKRASEIGGLDLDDPDARLALELELRARAAP